MSVTDDSARQKQILVIAAEIIASGSKLWTDGIAAKLGISTRRTSHSIAAMNRRGAWPYSWPLGRPTFREQYEGKPCDLCGQPLDAYHKGEPFDLEGLICSSCYRALQIERDRKVRNIRRSKEKQEAIKKAEAKERRLHGVVTKRLVIVTREKEAQRNFIGMNEHPEQHRLFMKYHFRPERGRMRVRDRFANQAKCG